jgi:hypothetical protein
MLYSHWFLPAQTAVPDFGSIVVYCSRTPDYPYGGLFAVRTKIESGGQNCLFDVRTNGHRKLAKPHQVSGHWQPIIGYLRHA